MSMIKRATGKIEKFTDAEGHEVQADTNVVWADEKQEEPKVKDSLEIPQTTDIEIDINSTDDDDSVIAKDC